MSSVNKVILVGNVGQDPEIRYLPSGDAVANVSLATSEQWKDKQTGERREATEWHRINFFGKLAEIVETYVRKGAKLYVEGQIRTEKYQDKEGKDRYATKIRADVMRMLGSPRDDNDQGGGETRQQSRQQPRQPQRQAQSNQGGGNSYQQAREGRAPSRGAPSGFDDMDDDIPFATANPSFDMVPRKQRRMARYPR